MPDSLNGARCGTSGPLHSFRYNNIKISERSEPKIFKVMLKVHKNITENVYLPDFRGGAYACSAPPKSAYVNSVQITLSLEIIIF